MHTYSFGSQKSELCLMGLKSRCRAELHSFWKLEGSLACSSVWRLPAFLGSWSLSPSSKPAMWQLPLSLSDSLITLPFLPHFGPWTLGRSVISFVVVV